MHPKLDFWSVWSFFQDLLRFFGSGAWPQKIFQKISIQKMLKSVQKWSLLVQFFKNFRPVKDTKRAAILRAANFRPEARPGPARPGPCTSLI